MVFESEKYEPFGGSRPLSDLKPPTKIKHMQFSGTPPPFFRIENHLIPISRIVEIGYIPSQTIYCIGSIVYFERHIAEKHAKEEKDITPIRTPVLIIYYTDVINQVDFVRRHGDAATELWKYLTEHLTIPA